MRVYISVDMERGGGRGPWRSDRSHRAPACRGV